MAADGLLRDGARASAAMVLTHFSQKILISAPEGLPGNSLWPSDATLIWVNIGSGNGLLPDMTKPISWTNVD